MTRDALAVHGQTRGDLQPCRACERTFNYVYRQAKLVKCGFLETQIFERELAYSVSGLFIPYLR
jgi:hypothetical protein